MTLKDDCYNGYFIPGGTTVITNAWYVLISRLISRYMHVFGLLNIYRYRAISRDPRYFPDSGTFRPERYLDEATGRLNHFVPHTHGYGHVAFGSGRRYVFTSPAKFLSSTLICAPRAGFALVRTSQCKRCSWTSPHCSGRSTSSRHSTARGGPCSLRARATRLRDKASSCEWHTSLSPTDGEKHFAVTLFCSPARSSRAQEKSAK